MITYKNYAETVGDFGYENLNVTLKQDYDVLKEATSNFTNWDLYHEDKESKHIMDAAFNALHAFIGSHAQKEKKPKAGKMPAAKGHKKEPKKKARIKEAEDHKHEPKLVEHIDEQVKFIRRFVGLHNREKPLKMFLNLLKAVQKAIVQRMIRKTSTYANYIEHIQQVLVKACNQGKSTIHMMIDEKDLLELVSIAGGEKVYPSIGIIKRYIGMEGKALEKEKRLSFIKQIETGIKKGRFDHDPYHEKIKDIASELKKIKSEKTAVRITSAELNGLSGLVRKLNKGIGTIYHTHGKKLRSCSCGTYSDAKGKGTCSHNRGLAGIMSAQDVLQQHYDMLPFTGVWKSLFGKPARNFSLLLHGGPGAGKTTFMMLFIKFLSTLGKVLYISSEEYGASTLKEKIKQYLTPTPDNVFFTADKSKIGQDHYDFVVLDSVTNIGMDIEEFKKLKAGYPDTSFIALLQHTKKGQFRGSQEWEHETEIAAEVEEGTIRVYRNRYGVMGEWNFFRHNQPHDDRDSEEDEDWQYRF